MNPSKIHLFARSMESTSMQEQLLSDLKRRDRNQNDLHARTNQFEMSSGKDARRAFPIYLRPARNKGQKERADCLKLDQNVVEKREV